MIIKNDKGEDVEVFTSEEVKQKEEAAAKTAAEKAVEDFKTQNPDKSQELTDLKDKVADLEAKLQEAEEGDGTDKDAQVKRLREERDAAKGDLKKAQEDWDSKFENFKKEMVGDIKSEILDKLSRGDAELRKKIELEFDNYRPNDNSKKGIADRMEKAYQLATGNKPSPNILDNISGGGDRGTGGGYKPETKKQWSSNEKAIGNVLGISDKDREMYEQYKAQNK